MPLPKRRHSRTRGRKRRTGWTLEAPNVVACSSCGQAVLPHHICHNCGEYKGRKVLDIKEA